MTENESGYRVKTPKRAKKDMELAVYERYQVDWMLKNGMSLSDLSILLSGMPDNIKRNAKTANRLTEAIHTTCPDRKIWDDFETFRMCAYTNTGYIRDLMKDNMEIFLEYLYWNRIDPLDVFSIEQCEQMVEKGILEREPRMQVVSITVEKTMRFEMTKTVSWEQMEQLRHNINPFQDEFDKMMETCPDRCDGEYDYTVSDADGNVLVDWG